MVYVLLPLLVASATALTHSGGMSWSGCSTPPEKDLDMFIVYDITSKGVIDTSRASIAEALEKLHQTYVDAGFEAVASLGWGGQLVEKACFTTAHSDTTLLKVSAAFDKTPSQAYLAHRSIDVQPIIWLQQNRWISAKIADSVRRVYVLLTGSNPSHEDGSDDMMTEALQLVPNQPLDASCPVEDRLPPLQQVLTAFRESKAGWAVHYSKPDLWGVMYVQVDWERFLLRLGHDDVIFRSQSYLDFSTEAVWGTLQAITCPEFYATTSTSSLQSSTSTKNPPLDIEKCILDLDKCSQDQEAMHAQLEKCLAA